MQIFLFPFLVKTWHLRIIKPPFFSANNTHSHSTAKQFTNFTFEINNTIDVVACSTNIIIISWSRCLCVCSLFKKSVIFSRSNLSIFKTKIVYQYDDDEQDEWISFLFSYIYIKKIKYHKNKKCSIWMS